MNYTNKDYYDYILKIDNINSPLHDIYQKILKLLLKEGLDKTIDEESMKSFFNLFKIRQFRLKEKELEDLNNLLYYDSVFRRIVENANGSYSIYPELKELPTVNDLLKYYSLGLKMSTKEIISYLTPLINEKKTKFKKGTIENYYGSPKYLILQTKAIYDAVTLLNNRDDIEDKTLVSKTLSNIISLLNKMLNIVGLENNEESYYNLNDYDYKPYINKTQYDLLKNCYLKILEQEKALIDLSNKIWQSYALKNNCILIHKLTEEAVESDKMEKICTSFDSNNTKNIVAKWFNANTGYIYPIDINNIYTICETDVGSWKITKEQYIERGIPEDCQLDEDNLCYEYPHHSKLFPPEYIEEQIINNNKFAEIIIDNRKQKVKPLYCFYTPNATIEQIKEINYLAKKQGLEVKCLERKEEKMPKPKC